MRVVFICLSIVFSALGSASYGYSKCLIFDAFQRLYTTELRLSSPENRFSFENDLQFLSWQSGYLLSEDIAADLDEVLKPNQLRTLQTFLKNAQVASRVETGIDVLTFFSNRDVQTNLAAMGRILDQNKCEPIETESTADEPILPIAVSIQVKDDIADNGEGEGTGDGNSNVEDEGESEGEGIEALEPSESKQIRNTIQDALNPTRIILITLGSILTFLIVKFIRNRSLLNKRRARRFPCHLTTQYKYKDQTVDTQVIDISGKGTKISLELDNPPELHEEIQIKLLDQWQAGQVRWINAHYCGINFSQPLSRRAVLTIVKMT